MSVSVTCSCGQMLAAADDQAGKTVLCPQCGLVVTVPYDGLIIQPIVLPPARSWKAIAALVLGLASAVLWVFEPLPALVVGGGGGVLGILALFDTWRNPRRFCGQGSAWLGIAAGVLGVALVGPAIERIREAADRAH